MLSEAAKLRGRAVESEKRGSLSPPPRSQFRSARGVSSLSLFSRARRYDAGGGGVLGALGLGPGRAPKCRKRAHSRAAPLVAALVPPFVGRLIPAAVAALGPLHGGAIGARFGGGGAVVALAHDAARRVLFTLSERGVVEAYVRERERERERPGPSRPPARPPARGSAPGFSRI